MKKIIFWLFLTVFSLIADEPTSEWLFACEQHDLKHFGDKRYFEIADIVDYPLILADSQTIKIDRKNKTIKVWTVWLISEQKRPDKIESMRKYDDYSNYGYQKNLVIINYKTMKIKLVSSNSYNCDGSVIFSNNSQGNWDDIIPGSVMEEIVKTLVERYKLK